MADRSWADDARCLPLHGRPPSGIDFFADDEAEQLRAVEFCMLCPVREECLAEQVRWEQGATDLYGVYGAKTADEREKERNGE